MNSQLFYEITTHLENPKDCLSYACVSKEYSEFWLECPSFDSSNTYFREKIRFDPRELVVYDRILSCSSRFIRVTGLSIFSPLLLFYCSTIASQEEVCYFSPHYKCLYPKKENPYIIYSHSPNSESHTVYTSQDVIIFYNPKKENPSPTVIDADIEYSKPVIEVIGIVYNTKDQLEECYSLIEESCDNPGSLKHSSDASMYTTDIIITKEDELEVIYNEHCRVSKLTIWYVTRSLSLVYNMCASKELLKAFHYLFGEHKPIIDHQAYLEEGMHPEEIVCKMHNVPPFLENEWYVECGFSEEKILGILPKRKRVHGKTIEVVGVLKQDTAKYNVRIGPKFLFDRMSSRLKESIFGPRVHIEDREDVCELYRLYTRTSCISPVRAVTAVKNNLLGEYGRYKREIY